MRNHLRTPTRMLIVVVKGTYTLFSHEILLIFLN